MLKRHINKIMTIKTGLSGIKLQLRETKFKNIRFVQIGKVIFRFLFINSFLKTCNRLYYRPKYPNFRCQVEQHFRTKIKRLYGPRMNRSCISLDISRTLMEWTDFLYYVQLFLSLFLSGFSFENINNAQDNKETGR